MDPKHIWAVFLLLAFRWHVFCSSEQTDAAALLSFKKSVEKDPNRILQWWDSSHDPCFWQGVRCTYWRVTELNLSGAGLVGTIPASSLNSLDKLQLLNLSNNSFSGDAFSLVKLPLGLHHLDLSFNQITGSIPTEFLTAHPKLKSLSLSHNNLTGLDVFHSDQLQILDLSFNNLSGAISGPDKFTGCYSLVSLDLSSNMLAGYIPSSFSSCLALRALNLSSNQLEGDIPGSLGELTSLQRLDLSHNYLKGAIPSELGNCCQSLTTLQLSTNNFSGSIPSSFLACSVLQVLD